MLQLLRVMFPYMLLISLAAIFMGMLNARGKFFIPALGAALLNAILIVAVLFVAPNVSNELPVQIFAVAVAVLVAGVAQAAYQLPALYSDGFRLQWINPINHPVIKTVLVKMIPGMLGVAAVQINVLLTQGIAFAVDPEITASYDYAIRLMELPQGVFGISLATFLLPTLTGLAAEKNFPEFRQTLRQGLGYLFFANVLASFFLLVLAEPIIRLIYESGEFTPQSTERAAMALTCLAPGLLAFSLVNILARAFYALGDTKTPMKISIVCLTVNVVFSALLIVPLRQGGMGIANTISSCFNVYFLFFALRKKIKRLELEPLKRDLTWMILVGLLSGLVAWFIHQWWDKTIGHAGLAPQLGGVFVPMAIGTLIYFFLLTRLNVAQAREYLDLLWLAQRPKPSQAPEEPSSPV